MINSKHPSPYLDFKLKQNLDANILKLLDNVANRQEQRPDADAGAEEHSPVEVHQLDPEEPPTVNQFGRAETHFSKDFEMEMPTVKPRATLQPPVAAEIPPPTVTTNR